MPEYEYYHKYTKKTITGIEANALPLGWAKLRKVKLKRLGEF